MAKWGGHVTGFRGDTSKGSGVVFEVRRALGLSQKAMAERMGYSTHSTIQKMEQKGTGPRSPVFKQKLKRLAKDITPKVLSKEAQEWLND